MTEKDLYRKICSLTNKTEVLLQRIESHLTGAGIPDVLFSGYGHHGFFELKILKKITKIVRIKSLTQFQVLWLNQHDLLGQRCYLLIYIYDQHELVVYAGSSANLADLIKGMAVDLFYSKSLFHNTLTIDFLRRIYVR